MYYIKHGTNNFTVIDCYLKDGNDKNARKEEIVAEIKNESSGRTYRFISTYPDNDHIAGMDYLDDNWEILNFYTFENSRPTDRNDYWIRQLFIDTSKILFQFPVFKEDESEMPTTKLLLWTSDKRKSEVEIRQITRKIFEDFGIRVLSKEEEIANLPEAKRTIVDAVGKIREVTRKNENLQQYNRKYGFCRNYLGACVYAIGAIVIALISNVILGIHIPRYC